jgi:hypothetical protein
MRRDFDDRTSDFNRIAKKRLEKGDFQPLWDAWTYRHSAVRILRNQGRDPSLLDGIPDHWSHEVIQKYMADNNWDVSNIPNETIQQLAHRTRERINEVLNVNEATVTGPSDGDAVVSPDGEGG